MFALVAFEKNPLLKDSLVYALLQALVYKELSGRDNLAIEPKIKNFYRYLHTINPRACEAVAANLGYGPSTRWMKVLNSRGRPDCIYNCTVTEMIQKMEEAIKRRKQEGQAVSAFSLAIDATKVSGVLDISTAYKAIHGGAYPNHNISTIDLTTDNIKQILNKKSAAGVTSVVVADEIKVGIMVVLKPRPGTSPFEIIAARPQTNNAVSDFTRDLVEAATTVAKKHQTSFVNFSVDGVSLEQSDVMTAICNFLDGEDNHLGSVDNKHNIKNDRYQVIGGQQFVSIGEWAVDADLLLQSGVPQELIRIKDFASDKLVDELCSHKILKSVVDAMDDGTTTGSDKDAAALLCTLLFMKLHLISVNGRQIPAKHRALYLWTSMIWLTTLSGVHITSKRNLVSETIANMFLVLRDDVLKLRYCTSEPAEHTFGNIRGMMREFSCSDFATLADKEQRRMNLLFEGNLMPSRDPKKGYPATYFDFVQHLKLLNLESGPCTVDSASSVPVCEQLWPHVAKIISQGNAMMEDLFKLAGVKDSERSPFCRTFVSPKDLLNDYVSYCPRTFSYKSKSGGKEADNDVEEEEEAADEAEKMDEVQINQQDSEMVQRIERHTSELKNLTLNTNDGNQRLECFDVSADDVSTNEDGSAMINEAKNTNIMKHLLIF